MISNEAWAAIKANPSKQNIEANGGFFVGHYAIPMSAEEVADEGSVKTPKGMIRCEQHVGPRLVVYAIPWDFRPDVRKEVQCNPEYAERGAA